jgi:hypothetical protein
MAVDLLGMPLGLPNPALGGILFSVLLPTLLLIFHSYRVMDTKVNFILQLLLIRFLSKLLRHMKVVYRHYKQFCCCP